MSDDRPHLPQHPDNKPIVVNRSGTIQRGVKFHTGSTCKPKTAKNDPLLLITVRVLNYWQYENIRYSIKVLNI